MRVTIRIFGEIASTYGRSHTLDLDEKSTVSTVLHIIQEKAGFPHSDYLGEWRIGSAELAIIINGKNMDLLNGVNTLVHDDDDLVIIPPAVGG